RGAHHGVRLLRADGHWHRHFRGHAGALGDPGAAHAVLRQPTADGALRRLYADRGHAEVDPALYLSEPDRPLRRAGARAADSRLRRGCGVRAALRAGVDRLGAGRIQRVQVPRADELTRLADTPTRDL